MKQCNQEELESLAEFDADASEDAEQELEYLINESGDLPQPHSLSNLMTKLSTCEDQNFTVSDYSVYADSEWVLKKTADRYPLKVKFDRELAGSNDLKKVILYHLIPDFHPFGNIRSYTTTHGHGYGYKVLEDYILKANALTATPNNIVLITPKILNEALDNAKHSSAVRHYHTLFFFIRLWCSLSTQKMIPEKFRLDVDVTKVDMRDRHKDVINHFQVNTIGWNPFSESDLEALINYTLFWTEKVTPYLLSVKNYIKDNNLDGGDKGKIKCSERNLELEEIFSKVIDGVKILGFSRHNTAHKKFYYTWLDPYVQALDKVRNSLFILVALITGMRRSELQSLTLNDTYKDDNGEYWINITRFKTTFDPNYIGEHDTIPLPEFVGQKIDDFRSLKEVYNFTKDGLLFQSNKSRRSVTRTSVVIKNLITDLKKDIFIDNLHPHRFRKTIAEILLNHDERNIDIIRLLFGHKSYAMTLQYISRNPYMVRTVVDAIETNFTGDLLDIVSNVRKSSYSGEAALRIAKQFNKCPSEFTGKQLKLTLFQYVSHLLKAGEPIFIHRTSLGTYCVSGDKYSMNNLPPCLEGSVIISETITPNPKNCQLDCKNVVVLDSAKTALKDNIAFYTSLLDNADKELGNEAARIIRRKIVSSERHLENLKNTKLAIVNIDGGNETIL